MKGKERNWSRRERERKELWRVGEMEKWGPEGGGLEKREGKRKGREIITEGGRCGRVGWGWGIVLHVDKYNTLFFTICPKLQISITHVYEMVEGGIMVGEIWRGGVHIICCG